jgi:aminomethyltransferase
MSAPRQTPLYEEHQKLGAKLVDFGGWALPVNYGSQVNEHHAVRRQAGLFDVSHMTVSDLHGPQTLEFLSYLLANDIGKANTPGKALYSCMLNEQGGVIDDLIVYAMTDTHCRLVTNAATNEKDMAWISQHARHYDVEFTERPELALIAAQGPQAIATCTPVVASLFGQSAAATLGTLTRFQGAYLDDANNNFVGRTGYTGEDGLEFIVRADDAIQLWQQLVGAAMQPCGLGARDTLRLESGMSLYGNDLDEEHTPAESGIGWSVALSDDREFIGKAALMKPARHTLVGLLLLDKGVLRGHQDVMANETKIGLTTSGTYSPTLEQSIALARVDKDATIDVGNIVQIAVRNRLLDAEVVRFPFVKNGKANR